MDRTDVLYTVGSLLAIYATAYTVTALSFPAFFVRHLSVDRDRRPVDFMYTPQRAIWAGRAQLALTIVAGGYLIYRASAPLVDWMPFDWGGQDEDGEWSSTRDTARGFLTLVGTGWLLVSAERAAKAQLREERKQ